MYKIVSEGNKYIYSYFINAQVILFLRKCFHCHTRFINTQIILCLRKCFHYQLGLTIAFFILFYYFILGSYYILCLCKCFHLHIPLNALNFFISNSLHYCVCESFYSNSLIYKWNSNCASNIKNRDDRKNIKLLKHEK